MTDSRVGACLFIVTRSQELQNFENHTCQSMNQLVSVVVLRKGTRGIFLVRRTLDLLKPAKVICIWKD